MLARLWVHIKKPSSFILLSLGSLGGRADHPVWLGACWDILCMVTQHGQARCSLPTTCSILPSFIAAVSGADVRLAQRPGSFPHKVFVSLVTRPNGICNNLSSGCPQEWCGCMELDVLGVRSLLGCCKDGKSKHLAPLQAKPVG